MGCLVPESARRGSQSTCRSPEAYIGDIGAILGDGWQYGRLSTTKIDYAHWKDTPVWRDPEDCVAAVKGKYADLPNTEARMSWLKEQGCPVRE